MSKGGRGPVRFNIVAKFKLNSVSTNQLVFLVDVKIYLCIFYEEQIVPPHICGHEEKTLIVNICCQPSRS